MTAIKPHLSAAELEQHYKTAAAPIAKSHFQALWLLSRGYDTGDGDIRALVADTQKRGCRASVVSTLKTEPPMVADELRRQADQFIDRADLADLRLVIDSRYSGWPCSSGSLSP